MSRLSHEHRGWTAAVAVVTVVGLASWWLVADRGRPSVSIGDAASTTQAEVPVSPSPSPVTMVPEASPTAEPSASPSDPGPPSDPAPASPSPEVGTTSPTPSEPAVASEPPPSPSPSVSPVPTAPLAVTVAVDRAHYYAGEQVVASARVCNDSPHSHTYRTYQAEPWAFVVRDGNGESVDGGRNTQPEDDVDGGPYTQTFAAGECREASWTWDRHVDRSPREPAVPGSYQMYAQYDAQTVPPEDRPVSGHATSDWFVLHDEPRPEVEPSPEPSPRPGPITVSVTTDQQVYDQGQVVRFVVEVCNRSDEVQYHESSREEPVDWSVGYTTPVGEQGGRTDYYAGGSTARNGTSETVTTTFEPGQCRSYPREWDQVVQYAVDDDPR
ncbi:MAG TPA: hypothetical protein VGA36_09845, partial [Nitriliruptorales bacterium]